MKVPLLDLKAQFQPLREEILAAMTQVVDEQAFIMGPQVDQLETALADYVGVPHAITCASGSDALLLALMALDVQPGDEVITTPYSFFATAGAIARLGAVPVFVDIEPDTFNLNPAGIEARISPRTKAIMPVHLYGQCADMDAIMAIANAHRIPVIEDAAQALGARWARKSAGTYGLFGCFSFFPSKNLGAFGDAGLITTLDADMAVKLRALRTHGGIKKYHHQYVGVNSRLDALQAAVLRVKLPHLEKWHAGRQHNACKYYALLGESLQHITLPVQRLKASHIYNQFVIRTAARDALQAYLKANGVGTEVYYPVPLHLQPCFAYLGHGEGSFPEAEAAARESLALPVYPELSEEQKVYVAQTIAAFFAGEKAGGAA